MGVAFYFEHHVQDQQEHQFFISLRTDGGKDDSVLFATFAQIILFLSPI